MLTFIACIIYAWIGFLWWKKLFWHDDVKSYYYIDRLPIYMIIWPLSVLLYLIYKIALKLKRNPKAD